MGEHKAKEPKFKGVLQTAAIVYHETDKGGEYRIFTTPANAIDFMAKLDHDAFMLQAWVIVKESVDPTVASFEPPMLDLEAIQKAIDEEMKK